ncbi:MAG TPA: BamA/TamA family outer membrane protein [Gemmatimonadaceae bacterium]
MLRPLQLPALAILLAGALVLSSPAPLHGQGKDPVTREDPEVKSLVLRGVNSVNKDELKRSVYTTASSCRNLLAQAFFCWWNKSGAFYQRRYLDREELSRDVLRLRVFYWKRGWRNATVDTAVTANHDGVTVTFAVHEGDPTRIVKQVVLYDSTLLTPKKVRQLVSTRARDPLDLLEIDSSRVLLQNEMWEKGYADAIVDTALVVDTARKVADLTYRVIPNRRTTVGTITILRRDTTPEVSTQVVLNSLTLLPGKIYRRSDVLRSQRNLYESNLFRSAIVRVPQQPDTVKDVIVDVTEADLRDARIAAGFNSVDYFSVEGRISHHNLLGGARRLDLSGIVGNLGAATINGASFFRRIRDPDPAFKRPTWQASIDFRQPAFLQRPENSFGLSAFAHRRAVPSVFIDQGWGGSATLTRSLAERVQASLNYRLEATKVTAGDAYFCVNFGVCDPTTTSTLRAMRRLSPLAVVWNASRADEPLSPTKGYNGRVELEHSSQATLSHFNYNRAFAELAVYKRVGRDRGSRGWLSQSVSPNVRNWILAGHLRLGIVRPFGGTDAGDALVIHPRKRFYAGGAQSVRGYGENQLGPRILTIAPEQLAHALTTSGAPCDTTSAASIALCDPNTGDITNSQFLPRPLGGTSVIEGSVELRFPIWRKLGGAAFVDAAVVGKNALRPGSDIGRLASGAAAVTPGFGVRYYSLVGPIRVDLGFNPRRTEPLRVVTEATAGGVRRIVPLTTPRTFDPGGSVFSRMVLHLSIGQAF